MSQAIAAAKRLKKKHQISRPDRTSDRIPDEILSRADRYASQADRHASQIAINEAQLAISKNKPEEAVKTLAENVEMTRQQANEYLPEALIESSYGLFLDGQPQESRHVGHEAFWRLQQIGSIKALKTIREILVADLVEMGRIEDAERLSDQIETDALGVRGIDT